MTVTALIIPPSDVAGSETDVPAAVVGAPVVVNAGWVVPVGDPGDLLAVLPALLGQTPAECLVVLGINRGRLVSTTQVALAETTDPELGERLVERLAGCPWVDLVVVGGADAAEDGTPLPYTELVEELSAALDRGGVGLPHATWLPAVVPGADWFCYADWSCVGTLRNVRG